ncbi:MAG: hypothetical protein QOI73_3488 [Solirubrobacteraceae bacterium]|nr:hypothetical protein [Solirubrobacteraceae bacterium]
MSCHGQPGAFQHHEVNIGWRLGEAKVDTSVCTKPGAGVVLHVLDAKDRCGIQSVRNPDRKPDPATRPPVKGADGHEYIWVYARAGGKTGWVRSDHIERPGPIDREHPLGGPTPHHIDFEVGVTKPKIKKGHSACGRPSASKPRMTIAAQEMHLRYSPRGTSFHYLHRGDEVRVLLEGAGEFAFVEVARAAADGSAKPGSRGWVMREFLVAA